MKLAVIAVTRRGTELGLRISKTLEACEGYEVTVFTMPELAGDIEGTIPLEVPPSKIIGDLFSQYRGLIMVMALGIVIRLLAPHVRDKKTDPAVVVLDEGGNFVISALSGHSGGANDLARVLAGALGVTAVITTATDVNGVPAVDVLARDFQMIPSAPEAVKFFNAALARGEHLDLYSQYKLPLRSTNFLSIRPWEEFGRETGCRRIIVTGMDPFPATDTDLVFRPRNLIVGVGCKQGIYYGEVLKEIKKTLQLAGRSLLSVRALATIGIKTYEEGLIKASIEIGVPLLGFSVEEINTAIDRYRLSKSDLVMRKMGVGGVCEPAALLACRQGRLLVHKRKYQGIAMALAEEESDWWESAPGI